MKSKKICSRTSDKSKVVLLRRSSLNLVLSNAPFVYACQSSSGFFSLLTIMAVALLWNEIITISRWRGTFITKVGMPVTQAPALEVWFNHLNRFGVLLSSEILFVVGITGVIYFRSLSRPQPLQSQTELPLLMRAMLIDGTNGQFRPKTQTEGGYGTMDKIIGMFVKAREYQKGQTMAEYALIMAAVAVVVFAGYQTMGTTLTTLLTTVDGKL